MSAPPFVHETRPRYPCGFCGAQRLEAQPIRITRLGRDIPACAPCAAKNRRSTGRTRQPCKKCGGPRSSTQSRFCEGCRPTVCKPCMICDQPRTKPTYIHHGAGKTTSACMACIRAHREMRQQQKAERQRAREHATQQRIARNEAPKKLTAGTVLLYYGNDPGSVPHRITIIKDARSMNANVIVDINTGNRIYRTKMRAMRLAAMPVDTPAPTHHHEERAEC